MPKRIASPEHSHELRQSGIAASHNEAKPVRLPAAPEFLAWVASRFHEMGLLAIDDESSERLFVRESPCAGTPLDVPTHGVRRAEPST